MNKNKIALELKAKELAERNTSTEVKMHSKECEDYRATHTNCHGCQYEPACSKMVGMLLATFDRHPQEKIHEILTREYDDKVDFDFYDPMERIFDNELEDYQ